MKNVFCNQQGWKTCFVTPTTTTTTRKTCFVTPTTTKSSFWTYREVAGTISLYHLHNITPTLPDGERLGKYFRLPRENGYWPIVPSGSELRWLAGIGVRLLVQSLQIWTPCSTPRYWVPLYGQFSPSPPTSPFSRHPDGRYTSGKISFCQNLKLTMINENKSGIRAWCNCEKLLTRSLTQELAWY